MFFDLLIRDATVIDGTGEARRKADVAIAHDRIAAIGSLEAQAASARRVVDAGGLVLAPGFIDVHAHADGWLAKMPALAAKTSQGFTSEVLMSDGISYAPLTPENYREWFTYLRALDGLQLADYRGWRTIADYLALLDCCTRQNVIAQIPYANVRVLAAGWRRGPLDDAQMNVVRHQVEQAMDGGATGISTGLDYIAQCFATTDELVEVCSALREWRGLYVTHVRYKKGTLAGVREAVEIGRRAGVAVHVSHLKAGTRAEAEEILAYVDRVAVNEVDFSFDVYPYLAGSTMLHYLLPYDVWEDGPLGVAAKLADSSVRARFEAQLACYSLPLERVTLAWTASAANSVHWGQSLAQYAAGLNRRPADAVADLLIEENLAVLCRLEAEPDELIEPFLRHPKFMLGSDGIYCPGGHVHPRVYGSAPRMLGPLVRDRKLFSLEDAVRRMTAIPAARFGLTDRGQIREGAFADLVLFDPATVADRATHENPHQVPVGIEHVFVNGVEILSRGQSLELAGPELPGRALRFNA